MQLSREEASPWDSEGDDGELDLPVIMVTEETGGESFVRLRDSGWVACAHGFDTPEISALEQPDGAPCGPEGFVLPLGSAGATTPPMSHAAAPRSPLRCGELLSVPCERYAGKDFEQPMGKSGVTPASRLMQSASNAPLLAEEELGSPESECVSTPLDAVPASPPSTPNNTTVVTALQSTPATPPSASPARRSVCSPVSADFSLPRTSTWSCGRSRDGSVSNDATRLSRPKMGAALHLVRRKNSRVEGTPPSRRGGDSGSFTASSLLSPSRVSSRQSLPSPTSSSASKRRQTTPVACRARRLF